MRFLFCEAQSEVFTHLHMNTSLFIFYRKQTACQFEYAEKYLNQVCFSQKVIVLNEKDAVLELDSKQTIV